MVPQQAPRQSAGGAANVGRLSRLPSDHAQQVYHRAAHRGDRAGAQDRWARLAPIASDHPRDAQGYVPDPRPAAGEGRGPGTRGGRGASLRVHGLVRRTPGQDDVPARVRRRAPALRACRDPRRGPALHPRKPALVPATLQDRWREPRRRDRNCTGPKPADLPCGCAQRVAERGSDRCRSGVPGDPCRRRLVRHCDHTGLDRPHPATARGGGRPRRRRLRADHAARLPCGLHHGRLPRRRSRRAHHGALAPQKPKDDARLHPPGQTDERQPIEAAGSIPRPRGCAAIAIPWDVSTQDRATLPCSHPSGPPS